MPKIVKGIKRPEVEIWKEIPGYDGFYEVSNWGRVRSWKKTGPGLSRSNKSKIITPKLNKGYLRVTLLKNCYRHFFIHRLVAINFISNPQKKSQVNHKNGIKIINWSTNLEWSTQSENINHAIKHGLMNNRGEKCGTSRLSKKQVIEIRDRYKKEDISQKILAAEYDISQSQVSSIIRKESWNHI